MSGEKAWSCSIQHWTAFCKKSKDTTLKWSVHNSLALLLVARKEVPTGLYIVVRKGLTIF
jgi:hypothetical protein